MILIISSSNDNGVKQVCDWLDYYGQPFLLANEHTRLSYRLRHEEVQVRLNGPSYHSIKTGWIRNPHVDLGKPDAGCKEALEKWIFMELQKNQEFLLHYFKEELCFLGTPYTLDINKLRVFRSAAEHGLLVPPYRVICEKDDLLDFAGEGKPLVTKSIGWNINVPMAGQRLAGFTQPLTDRVIEQLPDAFLPSFIQQYIPADLEIRAAFIGQKQFSMAQVQRGMPQVDIRRSGAMIDYFPFELPGPEDDKIKHLMHSMGLDLCLFDILYADNKYWLIDINPTGQFTNLSRICHYPVENEIARLLIDRHGPAS